MQQARDPRETLLRADVRAFLEEPGHFAVVATLAADGRPHQAAAWYLVRGEALILNSRVGRRWPTNLLRDPRVSVLVVDEYRWVSLRGAVEVDHDPERSQADIAEMARRYHADDPDVAERAIAEFRSQQRVTFILRPARVAADL